MERSLRSSLNQRFPPKRVLLIDQNEHSLELSQEILDNPIFTIQKVSTTSVSKARNSALIDFPFEWITFCDDDGYMDNNYSEVLKEQIEENPECSIFAGSIIRDDNFEFYSPRHSIGGDIINSGTLSY